MSATAQQAKNEMLALLKTFWDASGSAVTLFWPNSTGATPADEDNAVRPWARVHHEMVEGGHAAIGNAVFEAFGMLIVEIHWPLGSAEAELQPFATQVQNVFRGKRTASGVQFPRVKVVSRGPKGKWSSANVVAQFQYFEVVS